MEKMKLYSRMPSLDLHGIDRDYAKILTNEFIQDNLKLGEENIIIIHGIGQGIVKKAVYETLKINKHVKEYKQDNFNPGCTVVTLNLKKY